MNHVLVIRWSLWNEWAPAVSRWWRDRPSYQSLSELREAPEDLIGWLRHSFRDNVVATLLCSFGGHPDVVYYNPTGLEPDMRCKRCGTDTG